MSHLLTSYGGITTDKYQTSVTFETTFFDEGAKIKAYVFDGPPNARGPHKEISLTGFSRDQRVNYNYKSVGLVGTLSINEKLNTVTFEGELVIGGLVNTLFSPGLVAVK